MMRAPPGGLNKDRGTKGEEETSARFSRKKMKTDSAIFGGESLNLVTRKIRGCRTSLHYVVTMKRSDPNRGCKYVPSYFFLSATKWQVEHFSHSNGTILINFCYY
jgi:hypothetical protein